MHFSLSYAGVPEIIVYKTKNKGINLKMPSLLQDEKNGIAMLQKNEETLK
jgi:hypothetical protein